MAKQNDIAQGSQEWHALRARYYTASEAPAMMGVSPYMSRGELLRRKASGVEAEHDAATEARFAAGRAAEESCRQAAETILEQQGVAMPELYPSVLTDEVEGLPLLASLDGMTMDGEIVWEHKLTNTDIFAAIRDTGEPPMHHVWQLEHQLLVSGAKRALYTCGAEGRIEAWCWYESNPERRKALIEGWRRFSADMQDPEITGPVAATPAPQGKPIEGFGALVLRVEGRVLACNLDAFRAGAEAFMARLPKPQDLKTDQDFADAEAAAKACKDAEARIAAAKEHAIAQMADVDAVLRTVDTVAEAIRQARIALEKAVKARKEEIRAELVSQAAERVAAHYETLRAELGEYAPQVPQTLRAELGTEIKGLKTLSSMRDKLDAAVARYRIDADKLAERIRTNRALLQAAIAEHGPLWPDATSLAQTLDAEQVRGQIALRVAEAKRAAEERAERAQRAVETSTNVRQSEQQKDKTPAPASVETDDAGFAVWWRDVGRHMRPDGGETEAQFARRIARAAWDACAQTIFGKV